MIKIEEDWYKNYKKIAREKWGSEFTLWKAMFRGFIDMMREEAIKQGKENEPINPFSKMLLDVFIDVARARKKGKQIIMYPFNYGPELFHAMNLEPLMQEMFSVGLAPFHINEHYLDITNEIGYGDNPTLCNAQRPLIGSYIEKAAPIPDLLFFLSTPCNSLATTYQVFQHLTGVPTYTIDIPYWSHSPDSTFYDEKTLEYVIKQLKKLVVWLENQTHQKLDEEKFKQTMVWLNLARANVLEFNELLRAVPCPARSIEGFGNYLAMVLRGGTKAAVEATKWLRDNAASNVKNKIGGVPDEKIRIAWPYTHVFFDNELLPWLEENFNAVVIMDILGYYHVPPHDTSTIEKCFESLAKGTLDFSMIGTCRGPIEFYIDYVIRFVKDYKIDCVIMPMQFACKHAYAMARITSEEVRNQTGIPTMIFGCDPYDSREVSSEEIRGKIADFLTEIVL
ncbi:MAG: 2-hydroxyacyl-CoA dehydratase subunit D [Candidatus Helarchaeota archaeon]